mmetsp:Transcript_126663/g.366621  ORF Transcript_126663/g.366621 Transcript_126663/m.366621 type:complete len:302 (-) Transcript_126663:2199-3104(-)
MERAKPLGPRVEENHVLQPDAKVGHHIQRRSFRRPHEQPSASNLAGQVILHHLPQIHGAHRIDVAVVDGQLALITGQVPLGHSRFDLGAVHLDHLKPHLIEALVLPATGAGLHGEAEVLCATNVVVDPLLAVLGGLDPNLQVCENAAHAQSPLLHRLLRVLPHRLINGHIREDDLVQPRRPQHGHVPTLWRGHARQWSPPLAIRMVAGELGPQLVATALALRDNMLDLLVRIRKEASQDLVDLVAGDGGLRPCRPVAGDEACPHHEHDDEANTPSHPAAGQPRQAAGAMDVRCRRHRRLRH